MTLLDLVQTFPSSLGKETIDIGSSSSLNDVRSSPEWIVVIGLWLPDAQFPRNEKCLTLLLTPDGTIGRIC